MKVSTFHSLLESNAFEWGNLKIHFYVVRNDIFIMEELKIEIKFLNYSKVVHAIDHKYCFIRHFSFKFINY